MGSRAAHVIEQLPVWFRNNWREFLLAVALLGTAGVGAGWLGSYTPLRILAAILALILVIRDVKRMFRTVVGNVALVAFLLWSSASLAWTTDVWASVTTLAGLFSVTAIGAYMAQPERLAHRLGLILLLFTGTSVASLILILAVPAIGSVVVDHPVEGILLQPIGVFSWNSDLAFTASLAAVIAYAIYLDTNRWTFLGLVIVNVVVVVISNSVASLAVLVGGLGILLIIRRPRTTSLAIGIGAIVAGITFALFGGARFADLLLGLFERSPNLTGRTSLWQLALDQVGPKRWIGMGAGVNPDYTGVSAAAHSHNGYVQLIFDRGIIGLVFLVAIVMLAICGIVKRRRWTMLSVLFMVLVANIANDYLSFASLGMLVLIWIALSGSIGRAIPLPGEAQWVAPSLGRPGEA